MREVNTDTHPDNACPPFPLDYNLKAIITTVFSYDYDELHCPTRKSDPEMLLYWGKRENGVS